MPKLVGGVACLAALASGIFAGVEPVLCLIRAAVALVAGAVAGALIGVFTGVPTPVRPEPSDGSDAEGLSADMKS